MLNKKNPKKPITSLLLIFADNLTLPVLARKAISYFLVHILSEELYRCNIQDSSLGKK